MKGSMHKMNSMRDCCICSQIAGCKGNDLLYKYISGDYIRRIALESESFAVIPSLGPISNGHVLICPKIHMKSMAELSAHLYDEFYTVRKQLSAILTSIYEKPIHFFEHGGSPLSDRVTCSTEHAHLHLVPADVSISDKLHTIGNVTIIEDKVEDLRNLVNNREYIYYKQPGSIYSYVLLCEKQLPSQIMRRLFVTSLKSNHNWNWKSDPQPKLVNETYLQLLKHTFTI